MAANTQRRSLQELLNEMEGMERTARLPVDSKETKRLTTPVKLTTPRPPISVKLTSPRTAKTKRPTRESKKPVKEKKRLAGSVEEIPKFEYKAPTELKTPIVLAKSLRKSLTDISLVEERDLKREIRQACRTFIYQAMDSFNAHYESKGIIVVIGGGEALEYYFNYSPFIRTLDFDLKFRFMNDELHKDPDFESKYYTILQTARNDFGREMVRKLNELPAPSAFDIKFYLEGEDSFLLVVMYKLTVDGVIEIANLMDLTVLTKKSTEPPVFSQAFTDYKEDDIGQIEGPHSGYIIRRYKFTKVVGYKNVYIITFGYLFWDTVRMVNYYIDLTPVVLEKSLKNAKHMVKHYGDLMATNPTGLNRMNLEQWTHMVKHYTDLRETDPGFDRMELEKSLRMVEYYSDLLRTDPTGLTRMKLVEWTGMVKYHTDLQKNPEFNRTKLEKMLKKYYYFLRVLSNPQEHLSCESNINNFIGSCTGNVDFNKCLGKEKADIINDALDKGVIPREYAEMVKGLGKTTMCAVVPELSHFPTTSKSYTKQLLCFVIKAIVSELNRKNPSFAIVISGGEALEYYFSIPPESTLRTTDIDLKVMFKKDKLIEGIEGVQILSDYRTIASNEITSRIPLKDVSSDGGKIKLAGREFQRTLQFAFVMPDRTNLDIVDMNLVHPVISAPHLFSSYVGLESDDYKNGKRVGFIEMKFQYTRMLDDPYLYVVTFGYLVWDTIRMVNEYRNLLNSGKKTDKNTKKMKRMFRKYNLVLDALDNPGKYINCRDNVIRFIEKCNSIRIGNPTDKIAVDTLLKLVSAGRLPRAIGQTLTETLATPSPSPFAPSDLAPMDRSVDEKE